MPRAPLSVSVQLEAVPAEDDPEQVELRPPVEGGDEVADRMLAVGSRARAMLARGEEAAAHDALWLGRLLRALTEARFVLHAQPIVNLASEQRVRHELLIRMTGSDGELIAPADFLPVAERYGLMSEIDGWVLRQAACLAAGGHAIQTNVSGATLADPDLAGRVEREIRDAGADPQLLTFEITETALIRDEALAKGFISGARALGCRVAFDDFGTGYAGFSYLKRFPVDCLKIHREFVVDVVRDTASQNVIRAIVQLARGFGLDTVAEGVEDGDTADRLRALGVEHAQGYHFARPAALGTVFPLGPPPAGVRR